MENRKQGYNPMKVVSSDAPRSEKKQTVTITEDLQVVVTANNGVLKDGKGSVHISGEFVMNAKSVCLLIAALEGKNIQIMSGYPLFDGFILGEEGAKEIANSLEKKKKECDETLELMKEKHAKEVEFLKKENIKDWNKLFDYMFAYQGLMEMIERFNASRRPWERKIVVPDFEQKEESDITFDRIKELLKLCDYKPHQAQGNMKGACKELFVKEVDGDRYTVTIEKEKV